MALRSRRPVRSFEVAIEEMTLRVTCDEGLSEEVRAAGMHFWEQLQAYAVRHREFRTSKRPIVVPDDAPLIVREMAEAGRAAGVGPAFTLQGALTDHVGRWLARGSHEVVVSNGGDYFVLTRRRSRLPLYPGPDERGDGLAIVVRPELGAHGIYTTMGRLRVPAEGADGVVVVARSCILAEAAGTAAAGIVARQGRLGPALRHLRGLPGVHGALLTRGDSIGVTGSLELAA